MSRLRLLELCRPGQDALMRRTCAVAAAVPQAASDQEDQRLLQMLTTCSVATKVADFSGVESMYIYFVWRTSAISVIPFNLTWAAVHGPLAPITQSAHC